MENEELFKFLLDRYLENSAAIFALNEIVINAGLVTGEEFKEMVAKERQELKELMLKATEITNEK